MMQEAGANATINDLSFFACTVAGKGVI